jgi:peptide/nickel transport system substrate-binding protein
MQMIDEFTVRFHQPLPYVAFLAKLHHPIVPEHRLRPALERGEFSSTWSIGCDPSEVVGTGPYRLESYRPGEEVVLVRNADYWRRDRSGQRLPYLERVRFRIFEKEDTAQVAFLGGELDILPPEFITGEVYSELKREASSRGFRLIDMGQSVGFTYLVFNQNLKRNPRSGQPYLPEHLLGWFRDARFRRAVAHAIDREAIVASCYDSLAAPVVSVYNRACGKYHNSAVPLIPFDLDRARALLDEIGLEDRDGDGVREDRAGRKAMFTITWYRRSEALECLVRIVRERLDRIGIQALSNRIGDREYEEKLFSTYEWEVLVGQESGGAGDPMGADRLWSSREDYHMWFPRQAEPSTAWERELDAIFLAASTEPDELRRLELLYRFQEIVAREAPLIPIAIDKSFAAVDQRIENFFPRVIEPTSIYNIYEIWKRPE